MVLAASITTCYAVSVRPSTSASRNFSLLPPLSLIRSPIQQRQPFLAGANSGGSLLSINGVRLRQASFAAVIGDTTAVSDGAINEEMSTTKLSDSATSQETDVENGEDGKDASEGLDENKMIRVCDKLIEVFLVDKPKPTEWRRLLAFSKEWNNIRPHFYKRCQDRADSESDPGMKHKFLKLQRKLREVDDDVQRHNELLEAIRRSPSEVGDIVARRRKDFTKEFFAHLHTVAESYYDDPAEQNAVAKLGNMCLEAVEAYDTATESMEALNAAELKFQDIINSPSVDAACKKIDDLAQKNQLDSALMLMITKAWSAAKDSDMTKDEVKDVLYHLYKTTRGNLQRLMPKEIRILKYLLTIKDPEERMSALKDAFTPGEELEGEDVDCLYTTPEQLYNWIGTVLDAYNFSKEGTLIKEARDLMNPKIIKKMDAIAAAEERIVSERLRQKLNEVNTAAQTQFAGIQDHVAFTLQQAYYRCAYECFDRRRNQEEIGRCVEHCSVPVHNAQNLFQNEMAKFQERLNRSLMVCQDKFESAKLQKNKSNATMELESCVDQSVHDSINVLPHLVDKLKASLGINN